MFGFGKSEKKPVAQPESTTPRRKDEEWQRPNLRRMDDVETLMMSSKNEAEWTANCDKVKEANGDDYPKFWWSLMQGGLRELTERRWTKQAEQARED